MAKTGKPKPASIRQPRSSANGEAGEVLTLAEAAAYLRLTEAEVLRLVEEQGLPVRRLGQERRFLKSAIQEWLGAGTPSIPGKAAQLAVAGSWKDDPLVDEELKETFRRRGRASTAE